MTLQKTSLSILSPQKCQEHYWSHKRFQIIKHESVLVHKVVLTVSIQVLIVGEMFLVLRKEKDSNLRIKI